MKIEQVVIQKIKDRVDPEVVLNHLGFDLTKRTGKELRAPCKIHGGDNPTGFRFNLETRTWTCYTRHCEGEEDRDLVGLVQKATGKSFVESVKFLAYLAGIDLDNKDQFGAICADTTYENAVKRELREHKANLPQDNASFPEDLIPEMIRNRPSYFSDRGFSDEILDFYEVGGWIDKWGVERATIPIRDENGVLFTVSGRRTDGDRDPKYRLLENRNKGNVLYNLHVAKDYVGSPEKILIIVEGFVDVWNLCMKGVYNVVAIMGVDITPMQASLVSKYADTAYVVLDADAAGRKAAPKVVKQLIQRGLNVKLIELPDGIDPKDLTAEEIEIHFQGVKIHHD